jgi:hypothetical protein
MSCMHQWDRLTDRCSVCLMTTAQYHAASQQLSSASSIGLQAVLMHSYAQALTSHRPVSVAAVDSSVAKSNRKERDKRTKSRAWGIWVRW